MISRRSFVKGSGALGVALAFGATSLGMSSCSTSGDGTFKVRMLATSDTHGKVFPWDYAFNREDKTGSMTQLSSAISSLRDQDTLVLDAGDNIQGNFAEISNGTDAVHPMVQAMNEIGYDAWTTGNHEYNFGMDNLKKVIKDMACKPLLGNVRDKDGNLLADSYAVFERGGVKVGIIGMVTPNITKWDARNLEGYAVSDPADEINALIDRVKSESDVVVGLVHMDAKDEFGTAHSGYRSLIQACPGLDVVIASHGHSLVEGEMVGDTLVVENKNAAKTLIEVTVKVERRNGTSKVTEKTSRVINVADYESDANLERKLSDSHQRVLDYAGQVIGALSGGRLVPEGGAKGIPLVPLQPTALTGLVNEVQMHYSGAKVAVTITNSSTSPDPGPLHRYDVSQIYGFQNTLYKYKITGRQLRKHMEWSARFYQQYKEGDLTIAFNPEMPAYLHDVFSGVNYKVDISKPAGSRIVNLCWPDGTPVSDSESFTIAVNNYRGSTQYVAGSEMFGDDAPELLEMDVRGDLGEVRSMIIDYIQNVLGGTLTPKTPDNWSIIGCDWDEELHQKAISQLNEGVISVEKTDRTPNVKPITVADLK